MPTIEHFDSDGLVVRSTINRTPYGTEESTTYTLLKYVSSTDYIRRSKRIHDTPQLNCVTWRDERFPTSAIVMVLRNRSTLLHHHGNTALDVLKDSLRNLFKLCEPDLRLVGGTKAPSRQRDHLGFRCHQLLCRQARVGEALR